MANVIVHGVSMSLDAASVAIAAGVNPAMDVEDLRVGKIDHDALLSVCMDGVEDESIEMCWRDYVFCVCLAAEQSE